MTIHPSHLVHYYKEIHAVIQIEPNIEIRKRLLAVLEEMWNIIPNRYHDELCRLPLAKTHA